MERRIIKNILFLALTFIMVMVYPQNLLAAQTDIVVTQTDVYLPDMSVYVETPDKKILKKEEVKANIENTDESLTVKKSDVFSDTGRGIYYHILLDVSTSISKQQLEAMEQSIISLSGNLRKQDKLSVTTFGKEIKEILKGGEKKEKVKKILSKVTREKKTHLYEGINEVTKQIEKHRTEEIASGTKNEDFMRNVAVILTDWQEIKDAGGITSQEESLKALQQTGSPMYGYCLSTANDKLQDDMGVFLRKTGGDFTLFNEKKKETQLLKLHDKLLSDNVLQVRTSSNKTYDEEKVLELEIDNKKIKKEHLYLNSTQEDTKKPEIISVQQDKKDASVIVVTFSEDVLRADNKNNYYIKKNNKQIYTVSEATYTSESEKYQAKLVLNDKLAKGKYEVSVYNITDNTNEENELTDTWIGKLDGEGTLKAFYHTLGKFWAIILLFVILVIILGIYLYIKKHRGIMIVQDKMILGDKVENKKHIKSDQSSTKNILLQISGIATDVKEMPVQINGSIIVGRASICDIYFDDVSMSRQHFALEVEKGEMYLTDLESTGGTTVNGVKVQPGNQGRIIVQNGSDITAGRVTFTVRW